MLCLIEPDPLILENKLKICFSPQALTQGGTIKGDNCCLALSSRPDIFSCRFFNNCLWAIHYCKVLLPGAGSPTQPEVTTFNEMSDVAAVTVKKGRHHRILFTF